MYTQNERSTPDINLTFTFSLLFLIPLPSTTFFSVILFILLLLTFSLPGHLLPFSSPVEISSFSTTGSIGPLLALSSPVQVILTPCPQRPPSLPQPPTTSHNLPQPPTTCLSLPLRETSCLYSETRGGSHLCTDSRRI